MATSAEKLAAQIDDLTRRIRDLERAGQFSRSTLEVDGSVVAVPDAIGQGVAASVELPAVRETAEGAATDAAAAADDAAQAVQDAAAAHTVAVAALPTWQSFDPDDTANPGGADGALWFVTNGTGGAALRQFRWDAANTNWVLTPIDGAALQNVVADTIKAGAIDGQTITGATFRSQADGQRIELAQTEINVFNSADTLSGQIYGGFDSSGTDVLALFSGGGGGQGGTATASIFLGARHWYDPVTGADNGVGITAGDGMVLDGNLYMRDTPGAPATLWTNRLGLNQSGANNARVVLARVGDPMTGPVTLTADVANLSGAISGASLAATGAVQGATVTATGTAKAADFQTTAGKSLVSTVQHMDSSFGNMFEVLGVVNAQTFGTTWTLLAATFVATPSINESDYTWSRTNGTVTVAKAGRYMFETAFNGVRAGSNGRAIQVLKNSTTIDGTGQVAKLEYTGYSIGLTTILDLVAGDVLRVYATQGASAAICERTGDTRIRIYRLGS